MNTDDDSCTKSPRRRSLPPRVPCGRPQRSTASAIFTSSLGRSEHAFILGAAAAEGCRGVGLRREKLRAGSNCGECNQRLYHVHHRPPARRLWTRLPRKSTVAHRPLATVVTRRHPALGRSSRGCLCSAVPAVVPARPEALVAPPRDFVALHAERDRPGNPADAATPVASLSHRTQRDIFMGQGAANGSMTHS